MELEQLKTEVMRLSSKQRATLAAELISSLDDDADTEQLWLDEAARRYRAHHDGEEPGIPSEQAFRDAREQLK